MRLDKEFKNEVNQEFKEVDYVGRKVFVRGLIVVLVLVVLGSIGGVIYKKWKTDQDRQIFKHSVAYNESVASFLADSYKQYNDAETGAEKNIIIEYVTMRYPNLDSSNIENDTLRLFYEKCLRN